MRRVAGEEAALQARSEGFNLERKAERGGNVAFGKGEGAGR